MKVAGLAALLAGATAVPASASDACSTFALEAVAEVTVSDGQSYGTHAYYHLPNANLIAFTGEENSYYGIDGPFGWQMVEEDQRLSGDSGKVFALGHQFHALLLFFDEIMPDATAVADILIGNARYPGRMAPFPHGGTAWLATDDSDGEARAVGMRFAFPDTTPIEVTFDDWGEAGGHAVPYTIRLSHEDRQFTYRYTDIFIGERSPLWLINNAPAPALLDEIGIYRLHRQLMAAHCLGDAALLGRLTAEETLVASRGELLTPTGAETQARFEDYFSMVTHTSYADLQEPIIEVSSGGDIGWAAVNVGVAGQVNESGAPFTNEWAWIMLARKVDGVWLNAGNASNLKPE